MKLKFFAVILLFFIAFTSFCIPNWTVAVYLDADNNLESAGLDDFLEMSSIGSDANINIVVQLDLYSTSNSYGWATCKRFYVTQGMTPTAANALSDLGEVNMGDPDTLIAFGSWVKTNYPAEHYLLVLWDHGDGWRALPSDTLTKGACTDDHGTADPDDSIDPFYLNFSHGGPSGEGELQYAFSQITAGSNWDIIGFDVCLDQMWENNVACAPYFDYFVGSEMSEWGEGWTYDHFLNALKSAGGTLTPVALANAVVAAYAYGEGGSTGDTQSSIDLALIPALNTAVNTLAKELMCAYSSYSTVINAARTAAYELDGSYYYDQIDLYDLCLELESQALPGSVISAAAGVRAAVSDAVKSNFAKSGIDCYGVGIYYPRPSSSYDTDYNGTSICGISFWDNHLKHEGCPVPVLLSYTGNTVDDSSGGNGNGRAEAGESVNLNISVSNTGTDKATGISATLSSSDPYITVTSGYSAYPDIGSQLAEENTEPFSFSVASSCPQGHQAVFSFSCTGNEDSFTDTFSITIGVPVVLLVDDDAGKAWHTYLESAIAAAGYSCEIWDVSVSGDPSLSDLQLHRCVVWTNGMDSSTTLTTAEEALLASYLDGGGRLYLSSQDYLYDQGASSTFDSQYLHVASYTSDRSPTGETGIADDLITDGMDITLSFPSGFTNYGDDISPDAVAVAIFKNRNTGNPSSLRYEGDYRLVFTSFAFEAIPGSGTAPNNAASVMGNIIAFLLGGSGPAPRYFSKTIGDSAYGNASGTADAGETVDLYITLKNIGSESVTNPIAYFTTASTYTNIISSSSSYPDLLPSGTEQNQTPFVLDFYAGLPLDYKIDYTLTLVSDQDTWVFPVSVTVNSGTGMDTFCAGFPSTDVPVAIPDSTPSGVTSTLTISDHAEIADLNCFVDITHTYIGDLIVELKSPSGTKVRLHNRTLGGLDNIYTVYGSSTTPDGPGSMADFIGEDAYGTWKLFMSDNAGSDAGILNAWTVEVCSNVTEIELDNTGNGECIFYPDWSWTNTPRRIAYIYTGTDKVSNILVTDAEGESVPYAVTNVFDGVSHISQISWSPDDEYIIFGSNAGGKLHIRRVKADGTQKGASEVFQPTGTLPDPYLKWVDPHWASAYGQEGELERIAVSISGDIWVYAPDDGVNPNSGLIRITDLSSQDLDQTAADKLYQPRWNRDGTRIVFVRRPACADNASADTDIWEGLDVQDIIAGTAYPLGDPDGDGTGGNWSDPRLSRIGNSTYPEYSPSYSINGLKIGYVNDKSGSFNNVAFWTDPAAALSGSDFDAFCQGAAIAGYNESSNEGFMKWSTGGGDRFTYVNASGSAYSLNVVYDEAIGGFMKGGCEISGEYLVIRDNALSVLEVPLSTACVYPYFTLRSAGHIGYDRTKYISLGEIRRIGAGDLSGEEDFFEPARLSIYYNQQELMGMSEVSLIMMRYSGGIWTALSSIHEPDGDGIGGNDHLDGGFVSAEIPGPGTYGIFRVREIDDSPCGAGDFIMGPNPSHGDITIFAEEADMIEIYTISGDLAATLSSSAIKRVGGARYVWRIVNDSGRKVGAGIYIVSVRFTDGTRKNKKIAIVK